MTHQIITDGLVFDNYATLEDAQKALDRMLKDAEAQAERYRDEADQIIDNVMLMSISEKKG